MKNAPAETLAKMLDALATGKTVRVATAWRVTDITPKIAKKFADAGFPVFRASDKSVYMAVGRRYDCIDFCKIDVI